MKTLSQFIFEADSRIKKVERIISQYFDGMLDTSAVVSNNEYYVNDNPNTTWMDYLIYNLRHTLGLMANSDVALLPIIERLHSRETELFTVKVIYLN